MSLKEHRWRCWWRSNPIFAYRMV